MRRKVLIPVPILFLVMVLAGGKQDESHANFRGLEMGRDKPGLYQALPKNSATTGEETPCSGIHPTADQLAVCRKVEQQILGSTLRIEMKGWVEVAGGSNEHGTQSFARATGNGHGTIKGGRYLVTHNHFGIPLPALVSGEALVFGTVTVYTVAGEEVALEMDERPFTVVGIDQETLVFDFGTVDGQGVFDARGLPSATFTGWEELALRPGMEVSQVEWDGFKTSVNWVTIEAIIIDDGPARLVLSRGLTPGASGGGVFLGGQHIANNWQDIEFIGEDGQVLDEVSTAALNSPLVTAVSG